MGAQATHIVFASASLIRRLKVSTEELLPHICMVANVPSGEGDDCWELVCSKAMRGNCETVLMKNMAQSNDDEVNKMAQTIGNYDPDANDRVGDTYKIPAYVSVASFLVFDNQAARLEDFMPSIFYKLEEFGSEMAQAGFEKTERERLQYAWELYLLFKFNSKILGQKAQVLHQHVVLHNGGHALPRALRPD